jgi:hypothetical protein
MIGIVQNVGKYLGDSGFLHITHTRLPEIPKIPCIVPCIRELTLRIVISRLQPPPKTFIKHQSKLLINKGNL